MIKNMKNIKKIKAELIELYSFHEDTVEDFYNIKSGIEKSWHKLDGVVYSFITNSIDNDNPILQDLEQSIRLAQSQIKECENLIDDIMSKSKTYG